MKSIIRIINKIKCDSVRRKFDRMNSGSIAKQLGKDWKAYLKWRKRRKNLHSLFSDIDRIIYDVLYSVFDVFDTGMTITSVILIVIITLVLTGVLGMLARLFPVLMPFVIMPIIIFFILAFLAPIMGIVMSFAKEMTALKDHNLSACTTDLKRFLKHRNSPLKNMYKSMSNDDLNHVIERCHNEAWAGSELIDNDDDSYGIAKILYTVFLNQTNGCFYNHKALELIELMWIDHGVPLEFSMKNTGVLVRQWSKLSNGEISWNEYYGIISDMLSKVIGVAARAGEKDKNTVMSRINSIKHDSYVVNNSPDVVRIRNLVDRVHDSSTELVGGRAS